LEDNDKLKYIRHNLVQGFGIPIVLLHGWGGSRASFQALEKNMIESGHTVITVDFAGFGQSEAPPSSWGIYDYANSVKVLFDNLDYGEYYVVGHSFGGRVGIILGKDPRVKKLILCSAAGLKPRRSIRYYFKVWSYKLKKKMGISSKNAGSSDYKKLSPQMKEVFVRVVNQYLNEEAKQITANTLIVWGKLDDTTPLYMAKKLHKKIKGSGLIVLDNAGHYSYMQHQAKFAAIAREFFRQYRDIF
jgi:pimeloyl-ACP methyl ester carboxylesterase